MASQVIAISALTEHVGQQVRVGGTVRGIVGDIVTVDDGTGQAAVRLDGEAAALEGQLQPGDLVNVSGTVERTAAGGVEVVVAASTDVVSMPLPGGAVATTTSEMNGFGQPDGATDSSIDPAATGAATGSDARAPVVVAVVLLGLASMSLLAFAFAGRDRRARARAAATRTVAALRQRLARARTALSHS